MSVKGSAGNQIADLQFESQILPARLAGPVLSAASEKLECKQTTARKAHCRGADLPAVGDVQM